MNKNINISKLKVIDTRDEFIFVGNQTSLISDTILSNSKVNLTRHYELMNLIMNSINYSPIVYSNLFFLVELYFKYILMNFSDVEISTIDKYGHKIEHMSQEIVSKVSNNTIRSQVRDIVFTLKKIKYRDKCTICLSECSSFKYNRKKSLEAAMFEDEINEEMKEIVMEVIKCIDLQTQKK